MKRTAHFLIMLVLLAVLMASCADTKRMRRTLVLVDSLMESRPDSSLMLLKCDSALVPHTGKIARMYYDLLKTEVEDKLYIPHYSDSTMRIAGLYAKNVREIF